MSILGRTCDTKKRKHDALDETTSCERRYPRPRQKCPECSHTRVLHWGDVRRPYWSHLPSPVASSCQAHKGASETWEHATAKTAMAAFLERGGVLKVQRTCAKCQKVSTHEFPRTATCKTEYRLVETAGVADVAALSSTGADGHVVFIVEIVHSHRTEAQRRSAYDWCEVAAVDVLDVWDRNVPSEEWVLQDHRSGLCCGRPACEVASEHQRQSAEADTRALEQKRIADLQLHWKLRYMSYVLGYDQENPTKALLIGAATGRAPHAWVQPDRIQNLSIDQESRWQVFIALGRCMRCADVYTPRTWDPFCKTCDMVVQLDCARRPGKDHEGVAGWRQDLLRRRYAFLSDVSEFADDGLCVACKRVSYTPVEWDGTMRRMCTICVEMLANHSMPDCMFCML